MMLIFWLCIVVWRKIRRRLTSRCSSVKITGSATNTRLDSFVIEADRMWELTVRERLCLFRSPIPLSVAFSVLRN
uniref:Secreted protein n=1 Tax=Amphiprion ocellaris TaxID=80972 RepID=A0A3Q1C1Y4_AMPOC